MKNLFVKVIGFAIGVVAIPFVLTYAAGRYYYVKRKINKMIKLRKKLTFSTKSARDDWDKRMNAEIERLRSQIS